MLRRSICGGGRCFALLYLFLGWTLFVTGCVGSAPLQPMSPIPVAAQTALARAQTLVDEGARPDSPGVWKELVRARELAPDWIAPARFEDDLLARELRSVGALERRRVALAEEPQDPRRMYLVARLEGERDPRAWQRIVRREPRAAWAQHAHAWSLSVAGETALARQAWERAIALARSADDRATFTIRCATYLISLRQEPAAAQLLEGVLREGGLNSRAQARLRARLALLEMEGGSSALKRAGYVRGLLLVAGGELRRDELRELVLTMLDQNSSDDPTLARLERALLAGDPQGGAELLLAVWLRRGGDAYSRALITGNGDPERALGSLSMIGLLKNGEPVRAVEQWLASLPSQVLGQDGLPRDERLRTLVAAAHGVAASDSSVESLANFTRALLDAGWYAQALVEAERIALRDLELGMHLRRRALAGQGLFERLSRLLTDIERDKLDVELLEESGLSPALEASSLDDLLRRFGLAFAQSAEAAASPAEIEAARGTFAASPRLDFGILAQLVHPGPLYSENDERAGLGVQGEPVPGLAAAMDAHGRFAIVGQALGGGGPDATVLRRVHVEFKRGVHLGVPWQGTVAWCDGTDVQSRAARGENIIAGAALHEGYWIDLGALRPVLARWQTLHDSFDGESSDVRAARRLESAVNSRGLRLQRSPAAVHARRRERLALRPALEESLRLQLVLLRERAPVGRLLGEMSFDEIVELTATHEEGHLCDQTRFLPVFQGLPALLMLALDQAFSPPAIRERLEYRAELTALCTVPDPRLSLVNLLEAAAATGDSGLGHGPAYRELLRNLLRRLDRDLRLHPGDWPELSADHTLVHQLHFLPPEKLRALAIAQARAEGLVAKGFRSAVD